MFPSARGIISLRVSFVFVSAFRIQYSRNSASGKQDNAKTRRKQSRTISNVLMYATKLTHYSNVQKLCLLTNKQKKYNCFRVKMCDSDLVVERDRLLLCSSCFDPVYRVSFVCAVRGLENSRCITAKQASKLQTPYAHCIIITKRDAEISDTIQASIVSTIAPHPIDLQSFYRVVGVHLLVVVMLVAYILTGRVQRAETRGTTQNRQRTCKHWTYK